MTMVEPSDLKVQIIDFSYQSLHSKDISDLVLDLNFKDLDFSKIFKKEGEEPDQRQQCSYGVIMFRILDEKHIIMGDAK